MEIYTRNVKLNDPQLLALRKASGIRDQGISLLTAPFPQVEIVFHLENDGDGREKFISDVSVHGIKRVAYSSKLTEDYFAFGVFLNPSEVFAKFGVSIKELQETDVLRKTFRGRKYSEKQEVLLDGLPL